MQGVLWKGNTKQTHHRHNYTLRQYEPLYSAATCSSLPMGTTDCSA